MNRQFKSRLMHNHVTCNDDDKDTEQNDGKRKRKWNEYN